MKYLQENGMYAIVAEPNMVVKHGDDEYCHKLYRKINDFSDCTEVPIQTLEEEPTETDYAEAGKILLGVAE